MKSLYKVVSKVVLFSIFFLATAVTPTFAGGENPEKVEATEESSVISNGLQLHADSIKEFLSQMDPTIYLMRATDLEVLPFKFSYACEFEKKWWNSSQYKYECNLKIVHPEAAKSPIGSLTFHCFEDKEEYGLWISDLENYSYTGLRSEREWKNVGRSLLGITELISNHLNIPIELVADAMARGRGVSLDQFYRSNGFEHQDEQRYIYHPPSLSSQSRN